MANTCSTNFIIKGTSKVIDFLFEKIDNCNAGRYPNEGDTPHIVDIFGADAELFIDKIGSKWISIQDYFTNSDTEMEVHFESAWYPPSDMLKEIHRQLIEIDSDVTFIGIGMRGMSQLVLLKLQKMVSTLHENWMI